MKIYLPDESDFIQALSDWTEDMPDVDWLEKYFELFKTTVNWPEGLPFIGRSDLVEGTLRHKLNHYYTELLREYRFVVDNEQHVIHFDQIESLEEEE